jgi:hypothetical protein
VADESSEKSADPPVEVGVEKPPDSGRRLVAGAADFIVSTIVLLVVAFIFERLTSIESLNWILAGAIGTQNALTNAVASLNPIHLVTYWFDAATFIGQPVNYLPEWLADFVKFPLRLLIGFLALCALPIAVIIEGSPFEWALVFGFYLPLFFWIKSQAKDPNDQLLPGRSLAYAFLFTLLFYWIVQLILNITLFLFHDFIRTAQLAVSGSIALTTVVWAVGKRGEHTVTEFVLHVMRSREA